MIHYAVADKPLGPYWLPDDPTLFRGLMSPYVIYLVHDEGQVMLIPTIFKQEEKSFCNPGPVPIGAGDVPRLSFERERFGIGPSMPVRQAANKPEKLEVCFPARLRGYISGSLAVVDPLRVNTPEAQPKDVAKGETRSRSPTPRFV